MTRKFPLRGVSTVALQVIDHDAARRWYADLLGVEPCFDRPGYAEFRIGDYQHELGILDASYVHTPGGEASEQCTPGAIVYWHVDDLQGTYDDLLARGAAPHHPPRQFGEGFIGASVIDPFGNILGIMFSIHYLDVLTGEAV